MIFAHNVNGTPCLVQVTHYSAPCPMRITGTGFGDAEPPEHEEFEYNILDCDNRHWPEMEDQMTRDDHAKVLAAYKDKRGLR
ncbi:hypothetical protein HWB52_gp81 [Pseudomonas phage Littlefix]|uniref:Uncharacterized protein n=1 Tax=Pseudomonas phage Littlefix TaxID=2079289 RepID=A0A2K9VHR1_9CAUD|nr:hypothetical protein HWB52_gp81 [Pseudomonas phage Littlefix]AUV61896.1 hypothetical protein PsPhLittlefix_gp81 [Pseudomonas phage Littlefix]